MTNLTTSTSHRVVSGATILATPPLNMEDRNAIMIRFRTNKIAKRAPHSRVLTIAIGRNPKKRRRLHFLPTVAFRTASIHGACLSMSVPWMPTLETTRNSVKRQIHTSFLPVLGTTDRATETPIHAVLFPMQILAKVLLTCSLGCANGTPLRRRRQRLLRRCPCLPRPRLFPQPRCCHPCRYHHPHR